MRAPFLLLVLLVSSLSGVGPALAQEGHPLKGSWLGSWGPSKLHSEDIVMVLNWDGKAITGTINPGPDAIPIKSATLNPETWTVRFEADVKDKSGQVLNYVIEGKIDGLAFPNRTITGTWKSQRENGPFKIGRQ